MSSNIKAYLVRPYPNGITRIDEFRKYGIIAIGWPGTGSLVGKTREELKTSLSGEPYNYSGLELGNAYATAEIFLSQMKIGDIVLVPNGDDIYFAEIISDYFMDSAVNDLDQGYCHQRKVRWLSDTSRRDLSKELRSSLRVHRATARLTKHIDEIHALAHGNTYNPLIKVLARDGSEDEKAAEILSHFGRSYDVALNASTAVGDFFSKIGLPSLAKHWHMLSDATFRAAAFGVAHMQGKISD